MHTFNQTAVICVTGMCLFTGAIAQAQDQLAKRAEAILRNHCYDCHGLDGTAEGGLNFILDARRMVKRRLVIPGDAVRSKLYRQVKSGSMPKDLDPLTSDDVDTLRKWIDAGAASFSPAARRREFISPFAVLGFIQADLKEIDPNDRPFQRYFTITHLHNAGIPDSELETYRRGLSKLINSLSWAAKIVRPIPIDPTRTVLRIDINDFLWTEETWERIVEENPYGIIFDKPRTGGFTAAAKFCYEATGSPQPFVRADWFVASASIPPLYHDILDLPKTDRELEDRLRVQVARNLRIGRADRAGFNRSGVSQHNRLIERHNSSLTRGAYWKSYDFSGSSGRKNLFAHPLGPSGANAFEHDGGEIIFNLPNGLQAYLLVDAKGNRIDKGPTEIVSDPKRPDKAVVNGLSCMSCHAGGMIFKDDQVRGAVLAASGNFTAAEIDQVKRLYPLRPEFRKLQESDARMFMEAVLETGGKVGTTEPIVTLALRFEEELDLQLAAAEAGIVVSEFEAGIKLSKQLSKTLSPLLTPGGTVKREVYVSSFSSVVGKLNLGTFAGKTPTASSLITNSIGMQLRLIPAGSFMMGSPTSEKDGEEGETQHRVTLTQPYYLGVTEVTQGQWKAVMGTTPWKGENFVKEGNDYPATYVSWTDAVEFCEKLGTKDGGKYRLPTEAEWEYACRAGTTTEYSFGDSESELGEYAWYNKNAYDIGEIYAHSVGQKKPNPWGLYDMHGNVFEWCQDWYGDYPSGAVTDPTGAASGSGRVLRGGSFVYRTSNVRSADRSNNQPDLRYFHDGFRPARTYILSP